MMNECQCLAKCPFYSGTVAEAMPTLVERLKKRYCLGGESNDCARFTVFSALGREHVPMNLMPNEHARAQQIIAERQGSASGVIGPTQSDMQA